MPGVWGIECEDDGPGGPEASKEVVPDVWEDRPHMVVRVHNTPRREMFDITTCSDPPPVPLNHIDVARHTITSLDTEDEKEIKDFADGSAACRRELSDFWTGETRYTKLWKTPHGYDFVDGRLTRRQTTNRPPNVWPEIWEGMSKKMRTKAIESGTKDKKMLGAARARRGLVIGVDGGGTPSV